MQKNLKVTVFYKKGFFWSKDCQEVQVLQLEDGHVLYGVASIREDDGHLLVIIDTIEQAKADHPQKHTFHFEKIHFDCVERVIVLPPREE